MKVTRLKYLLMVVLSIAFITALSSCGKDEASSSSSLPTKVSTDVI
jgi:hypothetical protein